MYYILSRQYGITFLRNSFYYVVQKATSIAKHVAIKDRIQYLAKITSVSDARIRAFIEDRKKRLLSSTLDVAYM